MHVYGVYSAHTVDMWTVYTGADMRTLRTGVGSAHRVCSVRAWYDDVVDNGGAGVV